MKEWELNIYRGILTGYNEAFIIDRKKREELIAKDPKSAEIIRPILRGRDVKKYSHDFADLWLINSHNGIKEKDIKPINIDDYPAIKRHLNKYYPELEKRADKGITPYNLRNCAYMEDFSKQKIVWGEISDKTKFSIDLTGDFLTEATTFLMTGTYLIYLVGILNSKFSEYIFSKIGTTTGVGTIRWKKYTIEQLYVYLPENDRLQQYEKLILELMQSIDIKYYKTLQENLNQMIYHDIGLSREEIDFIDSQ